jgi:threonine/homoserine/homoserine lactone efflux protein
MEFLLVATAHFLALLSPGPDFFLILQAALRLPLRYALMVCAGIATANGVYLAVAVIGLEAVREMGTLMLALQWLGAGYLVHVGIMLMRAPRRSLEAGTTVSALHVPAIGRQFLVGFLSAIVNPKNAIFYLSLFTVMVSAETPFGVRILYALWMVVVVLVWDMGVAVTFGREQVKRRLGRWVFRIEKVSGLLLAVFGILLAVD